MSEVFICRARFCGVSKLLSFENKRPLRSWLAITALLLCLSINESRAQDTAVNIKAFVTRTYTHGVPYEQAKAYGKAAIPGLTQMLADNAYESFKVNIILTIGMIGSSDALTPLKDYFYKQGGELTANGFVSMLTVFQAFGYVLQNGDKEAFIFLENWSNPEFWQKANIKFTYRNYRGNLMGYMISKMAVQGLGISGRPEALSKLEEMQRGLDSKYKLSPKANIEEAIVLNKRVKNEGANKVFGKEVQK